METPLTIWTVVSDLTVVNAMSAGAAFCVNYFFPPKPDKDDDRGGFDEPLLPEPTGGDPIELELRKLYGEFEHEETVGAGIS